MILCIYKGGRGNDRRIYGSILTRWLDVSTTTIVKWQREGMPHIVIDGVTLYNKHKVTEWLQKYER